MILNPDTIVFPGAIDQMVKWLNSHPKYSIVSPSYLIRNASLSISGDSRSYPKTWNLGIIVFK